MGASTMQGFAATHRTPITVSAIGHILLLAAFSSSIVFMPDQPLQQLAIEAVVVESTIAQPDPAAERRREERLEQQRLEQQRQRELEQKREQQRQAELEQQQARQREAEAEQRRQEQLTAERQAEERRQAELVRQQEADARAAEQQRQAEQRAAEERAARQREAEAAAQREQERRAAEERARQQAARREQERREAELAAMLAEEEALSAARNSDAMRVYISRIASKVERKWVQPASAVAGIECEVSVRQLPDGTVVSAEVTRCNGDELVRRSIETAVLAASPLPEPDDRVLFDRNLRFTFRPRIGN